MYGTNGRQLREELTTLLRQHRIQQRLGGPGSHSIPATTTPEQLEQLGAQIQRYRYAALAWGIQAGVAADPPEGPGGNGARRPPEELRIPLNTRTHTSPST